MRGSFFYQTAPISTVNGAILLILIILMTEVNLNNLISGWPKARLITK
jgi:hypothetical protein